MTEPLQCPIREHEQRFEQLRELVELKLASADRALALQSAEYQRRLLELNHAAERLQAMTEKFVKADVYSVQHANLENKVDTLSRLVFIGIGVIMAVQFLLHYLVRP